MAAALRCVAKKIGGGALLQPQSYFTTTTSAAVREAQRRLLLRISHGGSSLRRFSSSGSPNLSKHGAKSTNNAEPIPSPWSPGSNKFVPNFFRVTVAAVTIYVVTFYVEVNRSRIFGV